MTDIEVQHSNESAGRLLPPMEGLVADVRLENTNFLTQNRVYVQTGHTEVLAADPAVAHFGGFELGKSYSTTLRIRNISSTSTRLHIIPPSTVFFKAECHDKKGMLVPGMAEIIDVEFSPREYRYYSDSVRIHSEAGNLLVPLHGYPIMNETKFPKRVDFKKVPLGDRTTKRIKMECKVPLEFEYAIKVVQPNAAFKVEPLSGIVPGHGHTSVAISFEPLGLTTEEMVIEVAVAEFNSKPVRCVITGSCVPGLIKERVLKEAMQLPSQEGDAEGNVSEASSRHLLECLTMEQLDGTQLFKASSRTLTPIIKGNGKTLVGMNNNDAYNEALNVQRKALASMRDCRVTGPIQTILPALPPPPGEVEVDGILIPDGPLKTTADLSYVLNQEPGRLRIKDIKHAIRSKKAEQAAAQEALRAIMNEGQPEAPRKRQSQRDPGHNGGLAHAHSPSHLQPSTAASPAANTSGNMGTASGLIGGHTSLTPGTPIGDFGGDSAQAGVVHPLERPELPLHIKAALFAQLLSAAEEKGKKVILGSGVHVGEYVMAKTAIEGAQRLREDQYHAHQLGRELAAAKQLEAVVEASGALHLPTSSHKAADGEQQQPQDKLLVGAAFAAVAPSTDDQYTPAWRLIEAADLKKRADNLMLFQRTAWQFIYTRRMVKSLSKIRDVLAQLGWDKQRLAEESANPVLLVSEADRPGTAPTKHLKPDNVRTRPLPLYRDINFTFHDDVPLSQYTDFDELGPMKHKVPLEYRVLGYCPEAFPGLTPYAPPLLEQPLLPGACEEAGGPPGSCLPSGAVSVSDVTSLPSMPSSMMVAPYTVLEVGNRYTLDAVVASPEPSWGMDMGALIQPRQYPFYDSTAEEVPSSCSVRAMRGVPVLSEHWLPRKDTWLMQLTPEAVPARMTQLDPADLLTDSAEDADKPAIAIQVPTNEEISRYLPPGMPNVLLHPPRATASAPGPSPGIKDAAASDTSPPRPASIEQTHSHPAQGQQQLQQGQQGAGTAAGRGASGAGTRLAGVGSVGGEMSAVGNGPASDAADGGMRYELMRQRQQVGLDATKRAVRLQSMADLDAKVEAYNTSLHMRCYYGVDKLQ